jgi:hypothetical protein
MLEGLAPTSYAKTKCSLIERSETKLSEADQQILADALNNKLFSNLNLAEQLTQRGFSISENVIRRHRIGKCACARNAK